MKKITSFLMMAVLCCSSVFAQESVGTQFPENKLVKIGTAQAEMVPGQWYFVHNSRPSSGAAQEFVAPGEAIPAAGGLVTDMGAGQTMRMSATTVIDELTNAEGVNAGNYAKHMLRFMPVEGVDGAFYIEFGTGTWMGGNPNTITRNQYIAGEAGQYNFYLITLHGTETPNTLGRFGWNKFDMTNRVDNNGAGNTVSFWSSGITDGEGEGWTEESQIKGNRIWQIYDIEIVGEVDVYAEALNSLLDEYTRITGLQDGAFVENLQNGVNVGTAYGNYRYEDVTEFLAIQAKIEEIMFTWEMEGQEVIQEMYPTAEDVEALIEEYTAAYEKVEENKVPIAMSTIKPGYYTINSMLEWYETKSDTIFLTQEEADSINNENGYLEGDEGFAVAGGVKEITSGQVPAPIKSMRSHDVGDGRVALGWGTQEPKAEYLWKIDAVEGQPTKYRVVNMYRGQTFTNIGRGDNTTPLMVENDTATICFDWREDNAVAPVTGDAVTAVNIRCSQHPENDMYYMHAGGHGGGAGKSGWIVGWSDGGATRWYLAPVDEAIAQEWMAEGEDRNKFAAKVAKADSIAEAVPGQIYIAKDMVDRVVNTASQFYSPYSTNDAQSIPSGKTVYDFLLDGNKSTYWHSRWEDGELEPLVHYLQIEATEALDGEFFVKMTRRPVANDHVTVLEVKAYTENNADLTYDDGVTVATLEFPYDANDETINNQVTLVSDTFAVEGYSVLRFYPADFLPNPRGYWHCSEFNVYLTEPYKRFEKSQYESRLAEAQALEAAVAAWEEKGYSADSVQYASDETFAATYNAIIAAYEAWSKVYVDPTALREAIAGAPDEKLFVKGNNPGQWKEGVVTPKATVDAAIAYNAGGAYTPAESQAHIDAIAKAETDVFEAANKVETGKWYRFRFASEEMYDNYGWSKSGPSAYINAASGLPQDYDLFDRIVAAGDKINIYTPFVNESTGANDTLNTYELTAAEYWYENDELYFFDGDEEFEYGEDLFHFVTATDSSYFIQHKATGLFLKTGHPVTLSAVPSYWNVTAIGAGANIVGSTDVFGTKGNPLHGERASSRLVTWGVTTLGSNSMMMIEEVEAVEEAPATEFTKQIWPGKINTYTYPVDIKLVEGATAYGASLQVTEEDTTIVLKAVEAEVIEAGTPFILIAETEGEYKSTADRLKEIAAEVLAEEKQYGRNEQNTANMRLQDEYAQVTMEHGMVVDTVANELNDLVGTLKQTTVEAGKGIVANGENGFKHMVVNGNVAAYSAYIKADFDATTDDVVKGLLIEIEGSIDTGIDEVLNKVAQNGNIYTVGGQLVGKGNINTVNNLPAGVYIVNGVKVTKK